jgi:nickel-dependent lactate racemase
MPFQPVGQILSALPPEWIRTCPGGSSPLSPGSTADAWAAVEADLDRLMRLPGRKVVIINDNTRSTPTDVILSPVREILQGEVEIIVATGTHRSLTLKEKDAILGSSFSATPWRNHDSDDSEAFTHLGETSRGTPVEVSSRVVEAAAVVSVNSVEPHFFAGFTGGRKSILPGVASRRSIVMNHYFACDPEASVMRLEGNPVHEDMMEALSLLTESVPVIQANAVLSGEEMISLHVGDPVSSFEKAVPESTAASSVELPEQVDTLIAMVDNPLDINLYQSQKAIYNCEGAVRDGGVLLLVSACEEGIGSPTLPEAIRRSRDSSWNTPSGEDYVLGDHTTAKLSRILERISVRISSRLPDGSMTGIGLHPVADVLTWLESRDPCSISVVPDAALVVPRVAGERER